MIRAVDLNGLLGPVRAAVRRAQPIKVSGRVTQALGTVVRAIGVDAQVGDVCELHSANGQTMRAEVIGFDQQIAILSPFGELKGLSASTMVVPLHRALDVPVGTVRSRLSRARARLRKLDGGENGVGDERPLRAADGTGAALRASLCERTTGPVAERPAPNDGGGVA